MVRVIALKLRQHPALVEGITARGGVAYLERCDHLVGVKGSRWEGRSRESRFIRCLIAAFETAQSSAMEDSRTWPAPQAGSGVRPATQSY